MFGFKQTIPFLNIPCCGWQLTGRLTQSWQDGGIRLCFKTYQAKCHLFTSWSTLIRIWWVHPCIRKTWRLQLMPFIITEYDRWLPKLQTEHYILTHKHMFLCTINTHIWILVHPGNTEIAASRKPIHKVASQNKKRKKNTRQMRL